MGDKPINKKHIFKGVATALVTPFTAENKIDYLALQRLIEFQIEQGINAIVFCGTTAEAPTLTDKEHKSIIDFAVQRVAGRVPVIAGCGSNDTAHAIMMSRFCARAGADGLLSITPYYNRPNDAGLENHYLKIADSVSVPIILYNVPQRTGIDCSVELYKRLSNHPNIVGVKEASDSYTKSAQIFGGLGDMLDVYAGNDQSYLGYLSLGGKGVISVASNILPSAFVKVYNHFIKGEVLLAKKEFQGMLTLINALAKGVNPTTVKYALKIAKLCDNRLRAPLLPINDDQEVAKEIKKIVNGYINES